MRKPVVDREKCIGCGACAAICSDVFELASDGKAKVKDDYNGGHDDCVEQSITTCPVNAISWKEE